MTSVTNLPPVQIVSPIHLKNEQVKCVIFDFGGVLVKPEESILVAYLANFFEVTEQEIRDLKVNELQWIRVNDIEFAIWQKFAAQKGKVLPEGWREEYSKVKFDAVRELPKMREILEGLKRQGYPLAMLSNFEPWMEPLLDRFGYRQEFPNIDLSYKTKLEKPNEVAYRHILDEVHLGGNQTIFIDDQLKNVEAAQKLGIDAIHFTSGEQLLQELQKRNILPSS